VRVGALRSLACACTTAAHNTEAQVAAAIVISEPRNDLRNGLRTVVSNSMPLYPRRVALQP
jgi:hypothetical protein